MMKYLDSWCCWTKNNDVLAPDILGGSLESFDNSDESSVVKQIKSINATEDTPLLDDLPDSSINLITATKSQRRLINQTVLIWSRDVAWTWFSYCHLNYRVTQTHNEYYDWRGEWLGQQIYGTAAMVLSSIMICIIYAVYYCSNKKKLKRHTINVFLEALKDVLIYLPAAAVAIFTWDRGQQIGVHIGQKWLKLSPHGAAFFSSLFSGLFEGITQYIIILTLSLLLLQKMRDDFRKQPLQEIKTLSLGLLLSITIGVIPGAVWQIVYAGAVIGSLGPLLTSILVAFAVAAANAATALTTNGITNCCITDNEHSIFSSRKSNFPAEDYSDIERHDSNLPNP